MASPFSTSADWQGLRQLLRDVVTFRAGTFDPIGGLRVALGVAVALVIGLAAADAATAAALAAGALLVGIPTVVAPRRVSLGALSAIALGMGVSTFVGSVTGELGWPHTAVLVPWCLAAGLLLGVDGPLSAMGTQGLAAMIVFGRFAEPPEAALGLAGLVLAGGAVAVGAFAVSRPPVTTRQQRLAVAAACRELAQLCAAGAGKRDDTAAAERLEAAEALLVGVLPVEAGGRAQLRALLDVLRRARLEILAIEGRERRLLRDERADAAVRVVESELAGAAGVFAALADHLAGRLPGTVTDPASGPATPGAAGADRPRLALQTGGEAARALEAELSALAGQLRAAEALTERLLAGAGRRALRRRDVDLHRRARAGVVGAVEVLRADVRLDSVIGRHAVRLAVVVPLAEVLALRAGLSRGYWVALTASVVLRPDYSVTLSRGVARALGTSLGVLLTGLLAAALHPAGAIEVVLVTALCALACATFPLNYLVFSAFLTGVVVLLIALVAPGTTALAIDRLVDTLIGGGLALVAYVVWPTWSEDTAWRAFAELAEAQRRYLAELFGLLGGAPLDAGVLRALARHVRRARTSAEAAVTRSLSEPVAHRIDQRLAEGVLVALSRVSLAAHALRSDVEGGRIAPPVPAIAPFASAVGVALDVLVARLAAEASSRGADGTFRIPRLRPLHRQLAAEVAGHDELAGGLVAADELVDAIDTLAALLDALPADEGEEVGRG